LRFWGGKRFSFAISAAMSANADVFVTSDLKYQSFYGGGKGKKYFCADIAALGKPKRGAVYKKIS